MNPNIRSELLEEVEDEGEEDCIDFAIYENNAAESDVNILSSSEREEITVRLEKTDFIYIPRLGSEKGCRFYVGCS